MHHPETRGRNDKALLSLLRVIVGCYRGMKFSSAGSFQKPGYFLHKRREQEILSEQGELYDKKTDPFRSSGKNKG